MAQTSVTYQQYIQNENVFFSEQSKAAAFMNKNIIPSTRPFGRDISNYRLSSGPSDNFGMNTKEAQSYRNSVYNNGKYTDNEGDGVNDLSMADLPKSVREPLLASRELLSLKQNLEKQKSLPKYDSQSLRLQKVPLNLSTMENCDILEIKNPQFVSVYAKEIFDGLVAIEDKYYAKPSFLGKFQSEITERMRAVLIDWLVELHLKFKLSAETLYLTVNLVDRFLEKVQITKQKLQLVGISCMLIASKYQEIYPPEVKDFVNVSDRAYRKQEILDMEGQILCTLNFKLTIPSLYAFLERFSRVTSLDKKSFFLCQYILETILLDYSMLKYRPSLIVGGAIELASKVLRNKIPTDILLKSIKQNENALKSCCKDILGAIQNVEKGGLRVIHRKFMSSQFMEVSKIQLNL